MIILRVHVYKHEEQVCLCTTKEGNKITLWDEVPYASVLNLTSGRCVNELKTISLIAKSASPEVSFEAVSGIMLLSKNSPSSAND